MYSKESRMGRKDNFAIMHERFTELAKQQPTRKELAKSKTTNEDAVKEARQDFVDFVKTGAVAVAKTLGDLGVNGDYFDDDKNRGITGYELRDSHQYGSLAYPYASYFGTFGRVSHSSEHNRKLVITASTGQLAIVGWNAGSYGLEERQPADSHWFKQEAITSLADAHRLQSEAQADLETAVKLYSTRR